MKKEQQLKCNKRTPLSSPFVNSSKLLKLHSSHPGFCRPDEVTEVHRECRKLIFRTENSALYPTKCVAKSVLPDIWKDNSTVMFKNESFTLMTALTFETSGITHPRRASHLRGLESQPCRCDDTKSRTSNHSRSLFRFHFISQLEHRNCRSVLRHG